VKPRSGEDDDGDASQHLPWGGPVLAAASREGTLSPSLSFPRLLAPKADVQSGRGQARWGGRKDRERAIVAIVVEEGPLWKRRKIIRKTSSFSPSIRSKYPTHSTDTVKNAVGIHFHAANRLKDTSQMLLMKRLFSRDRIAVLLHEKNHSLHYCILRLLLLCCIGMYSP